MYFLYLAIYCYIFYQDIYFSNQVIDTGCLVLDFYSSLDIQLDKSYMWKEK
jgi:hypothetical protein